MSRTRSWHSGNSGDYHLTVLSPEVPTGLPSSILQGILHQLAVCVQVCRCELDLGRKGAAEELNWMLKILEKQAPLILASPHARDATSLPSTTGPFS